MGFKLSNEAEAARTSSENKQGKHCFQRWNWCVRFKDQGVIPVRLEMSVTEAHWIPDFFCFDNKKVLVVGHDYYMVRQ